MATGKSAFSTYHGTSASSPSTLTALGRWSSLSKQLPAVDKIKCLHIYDFDNTLFRTPLPSTVLWNGPTIGMLCSQDTIVNGGWWHDNRILTATGEGIEKEEKRAWEGWWNEKIVDLVQLSIQQTDALCVLLTGRSEHGFADLVKRIVKSRGLEFDMVCLKPRVSPDNRNFRNTMHFKQIFLDNLMATYHSAHEIKVYEDRPGHTKGFRDFFVGYNREQTKNPTRGPIKAEVIQVPEVLTRLDPVTEVAEVQYMIDSHNDIISKQTQPSRQKKLRIKKTVFFTSYTINPDDSKRLLKLADIPSDIPSHDLKIHGNNILICPRPCPASILEKVGGMGNKMTWEVTGTACFENSIWAACLRPVPATAKYHTDNPMPLVVLALRKGARPMDAGKINNWQPLPQAETFTLTTTVSEKVILRIENDDPHEDEYESLFPNKASKRKHDGEDDTAPRKVHGSYGGRNESRGFHSGSIRGNPVPPRGPRGGPNRGNRNVSRGNNRGGRGRGGGFNYRSLDDPGTKNQQGGAPRAGPSGRPMGGAGSNGADLQKYY